MEKKIRSKRINELDALRGIAALMVVLFHFTMSRPQAELGFKYGTTGVDLFFIISGFVIFMSLSKSQNGLSFVINRLSRLYPTYWAAVTFTFIVLTFATIYKGEEFGWTNIVNYLGNMTMFQYYLGIRNLDEPYWTMIVEMLFYMGILFLFQTKLLKHLNIIGITLSAGFGLLTYFAYDDIRLVRILLYWIPFFQFIPLFFAGTIFYNIYTHQKNLIRQYAMLFVCMIAQILLFHHAGKSKSFITQEEYAIIIMIYFAIFTLFVNGRLTFIISKWTLFLGKISFALYLIHQHISTVYIIPYLTKELHINFWIASFGVALPIVIGIASFITYNIEVPMGKKMKEKLRKQLQPNSSYSTRKLEK